MLLRIAPLAEGGVLLSGEFHPGVVAVARRMRGVFLRPSSSWRIDTTPELLRSNLILELGLAEEQFEILDTVQELLSDGSFAPSTELPSMSIGGPQQEPAAPSLEDESASDIYLAAVPEIERTEYSSADIEAAPRATHYWPTSLTASLICCRGPAPYWPTTWDWARPARRSSPLRSARRANQFWSSPWPPC